MLLLNSDTCFKGKVHGCGRLINGSCKYHHVLIPVNMLWHCCSVTQPFQLFVIPWTAARQASLFFTISQSLLKLMSIESVMSFSHLILCCPLLLPSVFPCIRVFSNESVLHIRCQSIETSVLASVLPVNIQDWFPLGLTGLISLQSKGLSRVFFSTTFESISSLPSASLWSSSRIHT